jgi:hypothetical protein
MFETLGAVVFSSKQQRRQAMEVLLQVEEEGLQAVSGRRLKARVVQQLEEVVLKRFEM